MAFTAAAAIAFSLLSGCAKPVETKAETDSSRTTTAEAKNEKVRTDIVIGKPSDVVNPDPYEQNDVASAAAIRMMYDSLLVRECETGEIKPALAEKWEVISDTEYKFYIRKGVKFHTGEELTVQDVKFSLDRARQSARVKIFVDAISEVTTDESTNTVTVKTAYPYAPLLGNLAATQIAILSEKHFNDLKAQGKEYKDSPVGTGPMKFKSWVPNDNFLVVRNDEYWGEKAVATSVKLRVIPEESSRTIALQTGEVDMLDAVPAIDIERVKSDEKFNCVTQPSPGIHFVSWNMTKKPYDDVRIRQAMSYAVDKQEIIDVVCEGKAVPVNTLFSSLVDGYDKDLNLYEKNVEKAKALMIEAGYPNGFEAKIALNSDERSRIAQVLQSQFEPLGIKLEIELMEWGAYIEHISQKSHEMFILGWSASYDPDSTVSALFHSKSGGPTGNRQWYSNPKVDELIEKGRSIISWEEREPIYKEIQKIGMEDAIFIPLFAKDTVISMNKNLKGIKISPTDSHIYVYGYVEEK